MEKENKFRLIGSEKIHLQIKECRDLKPDKKLMRSCGLSGFSFSLLSIYFLITNVLFLFSVLFVFLSCVSFFFFFILWDSINKAINTTLYITSIRIAKVLSKTLVLRKTKIKEILLNQIAYIKVGYREVKIFPKGTNEERYINGDEREKDEIVHPKKAMKLYYGVIQDDDVTLQITELLIKHIPLIQHDNINNIFYNKN